MPTAYYYPITAAQVNAITNFGFTFNGSPVSNGSALTSSGGGGSGISNIVVGGVTGVVVNFTSTVPLTAANVGAVATNDTRYLSALTNASTFVTTNGNAAFLTNFPVALTSGFVTAAITNGLLATNGNGSALTGITAAQVGALDTNTWQNYITNIDPTQDAVTATNVFNAMIVPIATTQATVTATLYALTNQFQQYTAVLVPVNGTATVNYASGVAPILNMSGNTTLTMDTSSYTPSYTNGVNTVAVTVRPNGYSLTLLATNVTYPNTISLLTTDTQLLFVRSWTNNWRGYSLP